MWFLLGLCEVVRNMHLPSAFVHGIDWRWTTAMVASLDNSLNMCQEVLFSNYLAEQWLSLDKLKTPPQGGGPEFVRDLLIQDLQVATTCQSHLWVNMSCADCTDPLSCIFVWGCRCWVYQDILGSLLCGVFIGVLAWCGLLKVLYGRLCRGDWLLIFCYMRKKNIWEYKWMMSGIGFAGFTVSRHVSHLLSRPWVLWCFCWLGCVLLFCFVV